jgi:hypothetical protein
VPILTIVVKTCRAYCLAASSAAFSPLPTQQKCSSCEAPCDPPCDRHTHTPTHTHRHPSCMHARPYRHYTQSPLRNRDTAPLSPIPLLHFNLACAPCSPTTTMTPHGTSGEQTFLGAKNKASQRSVTYPLVSGAESAGPIMERDGWVMGEGTGIRDRVGAYPVCWGWDDLGSWRRVHVSIDCVFEVRWDGIGCLLTIDFLFFCRNDELETLLFLYRLYMTPPRFNTLDPQRTALCLGTFFSINQINFLQANKDAHMVCTYSGSPWPLPITPYM